MPKRKHRATAAAAAAASFAIRCSRASKLLDIDEECFVDRWKDEIDAAGDDAECSATAFDGTWL
jgi:hypothetical protein